MEDKGEAIKKIKQRMLKVEPLPDEPDFATRDDTIVRFLKAYEWKVAEAEQGLLETVAYRRHSTPLRADCRWCHTQPGYHSMRQVGCDESGRPVVYANFAQASATKNSLEDIMHHVTYLIENAKVTMQPGVSTWVFVIDCTGMTMSVCSPKVGLKVVNLLSAHYPERLGLIICVNHNPIFHAFWKAIKKFLSPGTASKMRLIRSDSKIQQAFSMYFPDELAAWMWEEITNNKTKPLSSSQKQFWAHPPNHEAHDPRGCPSYVARQINSFQPCHLEYKPGEKKEHCPHPNIAVLPGTAEANEKLRISEQNHTLTNASQSVERYTTPSDDEEISLPEIDGISDADEESHDEEGNHV